MIRIFGINQQGIVFRYYGEANQANYLFPAFILLIGFYFFVFA